MTIDIKGGLLQPLPHDGSDNGLCYGLDDMGNYLGVVPRELAVSTADRAPPRIGEWRWIGGDWRLHKPRDQLAREIELERERRIALGIVVNSIRWYSDSDFHARLIGFLSEYAEGQRPLAATCAVRAMDKAVYQLGRMAIRTLAKAVADNLQVIYQWSWDRKAEIGE